MNFVNHIYKYPEMLCGSACAYYLLNVLGRKNANVSNNLFWITDIASFLAKSGLKVQVSCFNSNLYNDFLTNKLPPNHAAYLSIMQYLETGAIMERKIDSAVLYDLTVENFYLIASVKSSLLNNDKSLSGYHYITIYRNETTFFMVNPKKYDFDLQIVEIDFLTNLIKNSGNWIIQIKTLNI
jgi:hypothetical protein